MFELFLGDTNFHLGLLFGAVVLPLIIYIIIFLGIIFENIYDYSQNKKEFKEWLEKRKEMKE